MTVYRAAADGDPTLRYRAVGPWLRRPPAEGASPVGTVLDPWGQPLELRHSATTGVLFVVDDRALDGPVWREVRLYSGDDPARR